METKHKSAILCSGCSQPSPSCLCWTVEDTSDPRGWELPLVKKCPRKTGFSFLVSGPVKFSRVCDQWPPGVTVALYILGKICKESVGCRDDLKGNFILHSRIASECTYREPDSVKFISRNPYCFCPEIILLKCCSKAIGKCVLFLPYTWNTERGLRPAAQDACRDAAWSPPYLSQMVPLPGTDCRIRLYISYTFSTWQSTWKW